MTDAVNTPLIECGPIDSSRYTRSLKARRLRGAAVIIEMLAHIGAPGATDAGLAKVFCDNELEVREMLSFTMRQLCESDDTEVT